MALNVFAKVFGGKALKELERQSAENANEIERLRQELSSSEQDAENLRNKLAREEDAGKERAQKIELLQNELQDLKSEIEAADPKAEGAVPGALLESLREQLKKKEKALKDLEDEIDEKEDELLDKDREIKNAAGKLESIIRDDLRKGDAAGSDGAADDADGRGSKEKSEERLKKRIAEVKGEIQKLGGALEEKERALDETRRELEQRESDLEVKNLSLGFVNEILNAPKTSDSNAIETERNTDRIVELTLGDVSEVFKEGYEDFKDVVETVSAGIWNWANLQKKSWLKGKTIAAFIGEFSAGKTSIVNRLFSQDKPGALKLKESAGASTAIPTYISYGKAAKAKFTDKTGELKEISLRALEQFTKKSLENVKASELVTYFVAEYDNTYLANLSILDTPGFSSGDKEDEKRTTEVIQEADALFWVLDAHTGDLNTSSLDIISKNAGEIPLYIVLNKIDDISPSDQEKVETKIKATISKKKIQAKGYIRFSKKEPLEKLNAVIASITPKNKADYDVIANIRAHFDYLAEFYENKIDGYKAGIKACQREINQAENIIESFGGKYGSKIDQFNALTNRMHGDEVIGSTFFGNGNKIKDVGLFWSLHNTQIDIFNESDELYFEYTEAWKNKIAQVSYKTEHETALAEIKEKLARLEEVKKKFNRHMKFFEN
ncbi:MAG: hypothetical protein Pg6C_17710 [Treponemataceae bacterium]|nr:MAG: hypothetical protein Pg6C_17710 [Treponemataceae bacterium]